MKKFITALLTLAVAHAVLAQAKDGKAEAEKPGESTPVAGAQNCGCEVALPEVLAVVNGNKITLADINSSNSEMLAEVSELERAVVEARSRELDLQINSKLLSAEAARRKMTTVELLDAEVVAKLQPVTDEEVKAYYEANKLKIEADFDSVKDEIVGFLSSQRAREEAGKFATKLRESASVKIFSRALAPAVTATDRSRILAEAGEFKITAGDIEDGLKPMILETQARVFALYNAALERKINDTLLNMEASKRKLTGEALLDTEVASKTAKVSEADALSFFNRNKERINGEFSAVKDAVISHLRNVAQNEASIAFADRLRSAAEVQTFLKEPAPGQ